MEPKEITIGKSRKITGRLRAHESWIKSDIRYELQPGEELTLAQLQEANRDIESILDIQEQAEREYWGRPRQ